MHKLILLLLLGVCVHGTLFRVAFNHPLTIPTAAKPTYTPPAHRGTPGRASASHDKVKTDSRKIADTARVVDQKSGAGSDARPDMPVANTSVTAVDGQVVGNGTATGSGTVLVKRDAGAYEQVFAGLMGRDAAVQGTAYLTYTLVNNATYDVDDCLAFCDRTPGCVFVNLYYEFNNPLLDFVFDERSNLKCAAFGDVHGAAEKTNFGGQQLEASGLTYMERSSGYALSAIASPAVPDGYELVFGPTNGANNAPGYMGFVFIDKYDVQACAALCNGRDADAVGGACQYFNIWRALVDGVPTTYTCAFYYLVADASTAVNYGQGPLKVTYSRGYKRTSVVMDGGFESFVCGTGDFCYSSSSGTWTGTSAAGGTVDASVFHYAAYARTGTSVGLLGSASGVDTLSGTLSPVGTLGTVAGQTYVVGFFANTLYAGQDAEATAAVDVLWNGQVADSINVGYRDWTWYETRVVARGGDRVGLHGGSAPAWVFIDDVCVYRV